MIMVQYMEINSVKPDGTVISMEKVAKESASTFFVPRGSAHLRQVEKVPFEPSV